MEHATHAKEVEESLECTCTFRFRARASEEAEKRSSLCMPSASSAFSSAAFAFVLVHVSTLPGARMPPTERLPAPLLVLSFTGCGFTHPIRPIRFAPLPPFSPFSGALQTSCCAPPTLAALILHPRLAWLHLVATRMRARTLTALVLTGASMQRDPIFFPLLRDPHRKPHPT